ncbi:Hypothetical_protein [Hexamita inflata]|uniref:Hypothetical_protein n=1 Tax=Hexamita inflata TaxID=28002 RepID=A0AA86RGM6_9EUKA|nr:Hypothetical protein HINF_LOCUS61466 [Hexamita inflata]
MKYNSLLSYTLLYSIVWDNRKPLLCNKKMAMDGYSFECQQNIVTQKTNNITVFIEIFLTCSCSLSSFVDGYSEPVRSSVALGFAFLPYSHTLEPGGARGALLPVA